MLFRTAQILIYLENDLVDDEFEGEIEK